MTLTGRPGATSKIEDYALIGDSRTAALVSKSGSIDWLCLPQFDSPSCLNRLLDQGRGGHFTITPLRPYAVRRVYKDSTAVLVTEFQTDEGIVRLTDCMPVLVRGQEIDKALSVPECAQAHKRGNGGRRRVGDCLSNRDLSIIVSTPTFQPARSRRLLH